MKFDISKLASATKMTASKIAGRPGLVVKKYSPEILLGVGVVAIVGGTVLACRATLEVEDILDEAKKDIDDLKEGRVVTNEDGTSVVLDTDTETLALTYVKMGLDIAKLYAPAVGLTVGGISCVLCSHNIMTKRQLGLVAAYEAVDKSFAAYREKVAEELGEDKDRHFYYGTTKETVKEEIVDPETGKVKKVKKTIEKVDGSQTRSPYARFFDDASTEWAETAEYNLMFLLKTQTYCQQMLETRGHLFLNEVYDLLDIPRSQAGAVVGWIWDKKSDYNEYVDFGIFDENDEPKRDFVNGLNNAILLDFNVQGVIYDMI